MATKEQLRELTTARPFIPFVVNDGRTRLHREASRERVVRPQRPGALGP